MTQNERPLVSILLPVYNGEEYLWEAIQSVLAQTFRDFELLVIDDGSSDRSLEILNGFQDPRIRVVENVRNQGLPGTLNRGISLARGKYIARMDCDDVCVPRRLEWQVTFMEEHPKIGLCGGWTRFFGETRPRTIKTPSSEQVIRAELFFDTPFAHPTVIIRKELLDKYRDLRYDPADIGGLEDWGLWRKCARHFQMTNLQRVLLRYRVRSGSLSTSRFSRKLERLQEIDRESLATLAISATDEQLRIHRLLCYGSAGSVEDPVATFVPWVKILEAANLRTQVYPSMGFREALRRRWFWLSKSRAHLGRVAFRDYIKGCRALGYRLQGPTELAIFALKIGLRRSSVPREVL